MNKKIKLAILKALRDCGGYLLPQDALLDTVRMTVRPEPLAKETLDALWDLQKRGAVVAGRGALDDGDRKWKLTADGQALLAEEG